MRKKEQKLTAKNFFGLISEQFPNASAKWVEWFKKYCEEEKLSQLFNYGFKNRTAYPEDNVGWHNPGFEDLPHEFQLGILVYFFVEQEIEYGEEDNFHDDTTECFRQLEFKLMHEERKIALAAIK